LAAGNGGYSAPFSYTVPMAGSPPAAYYMENLRSFSLTPEPSSLVLAALGALGLLFGVHLRPGSTRESNQSRHPTPDPRLGKGGCARPDAGAFYRWAAETGS
jgi:hypothetical protein